MAKRASDAGSGAAVVAATSKFVKFIVSPAELPKEVRSRLELPERPDC
jgi:hypothetical protein